MGRGSSPALSLLNRQLDFQIQAACNPNQQWNGNAGVLIVGPHKIREQRQLNPREFGDFRRNKSDFHYRYTSEQKRSEVIAEFFKRVEARALT